MATKGAIVIDIERCKGCSLCVEACKPGVLMLAEHKVNHNGYSYCTADKPEKCIGCTSCAIVCPDACITVYRIRQ